MINIFFLFLYFASAKFFTGTEFYIILTIHFGILVFKHITTKNNLITPEFVYYLGVLIVNIANINFIGEVNSGQELRIYNYVIPKYIDDAALIWCISSTMVIIGYDIYINRSLPSIAIEIENKKYLKIIFYIILFSNLSNLFGIGLGRNQLVKVFALIDTIGILFFARLWAKYDNKAYRFYAITLYIIQTYISLETAFLRFELILPTFYLFVGFFIGKGHVKYIFSYRIIPLIMILAIYSSVFASLQRNRSNFISVFTQPDNTNKVADKPKEAATGGLLDRSSNVAQMTNIVNLVERNGFYEGRASAPLVIALIPRFLWPDKPKIQLGTWFALEIGTAYKNEYGYINNSVNMTVAGELYLDFGWLGVLLGSLFFGGFVATLWNSTKFYSSEYNLTGTVFGGYLILLFIGSYADLQIVITLISTYLLFFVIKRSLTQYENTHYRPFMERK